MLRANCCGLVGMMRRVDGCCIRGSSCDVALKEELAVAVVHVETRGSGWMLRANCCGLVGMMRRVDGCCIRGSSCDVALKEELAVAVVHVEPRGSCCNERCLVEVGDTGEVLDEGCSLPVAGIVRRVCVG